MTWIIRFSIPVADEPRISALLIGQGAYSVSLDLADSSERQLMMSALFATEPTADQFQFLELSESRKLDDAEWQNTWVTHHEGEEIHPDIFVHPTGLTPQAPKKYPIILSLDMTDAFGDGHHPTTQLCVKHLVDYLTQTDYATRIMDIGTGTGILAIIAAKYTKNTIDAIDIDPVAIKRAQNNADLNHVTLHAQAADLYTHTFTNSYDLILANVLTQVLLDCLPKITCTLRQNGTMIISGVSSKWKNVVTEKLETQGLTLSATEEKDGWCVFVAKQKN